MDAELFQEVPPGNFLDKLRERQANALSGSVTPVIPSWRQWLQYWDDEESLTGNLRNLEHWLQRARN